MIDALFMKLYFGTEDHQITKNLKIVIVIYTLVIVVVIFYVPVLSSLDLGNALGVDYMIDWLSYHPSFFVKIRNNLSRE